MTGRQLRTSSGVRATTVGTGPPLVLLAGFGQSSAVWSSIVPRFESARTCVLIDNPGIAANADRTASTIEAVASEVADVVEHLGGSAAVLGWSMGGAVAQALAADRPDLVSSLVLLSTASRRSEAQRMWTDAQLALRASGAPRLTTEVVVLPWLFTHRTLVSHDRLTGIAQSNALTEPVSYAALRAQADAFARFDARERLPRITAPTLVVVGAEDVVTPVSDSIEIALAIPGADLVVLPQGGHAVVLESPADVVAPIRRFFAQHVPVHA
ncbi:MAG: alpha/beta fold hydrolase [Blastococcus sp.]